ncbi:MAG: aminotransferase class V-fold PLP-dependent enzyme [Caldilineaceae bacterium]|nr:aminotransferase class V-fold PLP-dependent enzyme [Caldilineaceae bacterium]
MYSFKFADADAEIEQIHRLNYVAFVEEIPQHAPNPERRLIDQFHPENTYAIGLEEDEVVAMLALRSQRPFSLDKKLTELDTYLPPHRSLCEIRLLYVQPAHRNGKIMKGLMEMVAVYAVMHGHDLALISGTTRQQRFYKHLGFVPFGPLVGSGEARFQPMFLTVNAAMRQAPWVQALQGEPGDATMYNTYNASTGENIAGERDVSESSVQKQAADPPLTIYDPPVNYLPGPVNIPPAVMAAMGQPMISHRSGKFLEDVASLQARLCAMVGARHAEFLFGSGTLANEAVAGQLSLLEGRGLVLINGEFGQRLADMAQRWRLRFESYAVAWGDTFDLTEVDACLAADPSIGWVWAVHSETSTGVINDLPGLAALCRSRGVKLCADCISSLGVVDLALGDLYLASATSGKALGAVAGLALVFHNTTLAPAPERLPSYLDLGSYRQAKGIPFTMNTNLVYALALALDIFGPRTYGLMAHHGSELRAALRKLGLWVLASEEVSSPAVTTIVLPPEVSSVEVGDGLAAHGFMVSYQSRYLAERNWIQICLMGDYRVDALPDLLRVLGHLTARSRAVPEQVAA